MAQNKLDYAVAIGIILLAGSVMFISIADTNDLPEPVDEVSAFIENANPDAVGITNYETRSPNGVNLTVTATGVTRGHEDIYMKEVNFEIFVPNRNNIQDNKPANFKRPYYRLTSIYRNTEEGEVWNETVEVNTTVTLEFESGETFTTYHGDPHTEYHTHYTNTFRGPDHVDVTDINANRLPPIETLERVNVTLSGRQKTPREEQIESGSG